MENNTQNENETNEDLLYQHSSTYTKKSTRLEDARSSSGLFIVFGIAGILLILAVWLGIIPLNMELYMKVLYTIVLGALFIFFILLGIYYKRRIKTLAKESRREERMTKEILSFMAEHYPLEKLDEMLPADSLSEEQLYFERYDMISDLIQQNFVVNDDAYLDYLVEKIYQTYSPEA